MPVRAPRPDPPYLRIVAEIRDRIANGELRTGERVPSVRQITEEWGVAMATATKVLATLRQEGLVVPRVGVGTVVAARGSGPRPPRAARAVPDRPGLSRARVLSTAIGIADAEGLGALSMRRLAAELDVGPMSLYRHVSNKDDLIEQMADQVFGERALPDPGPDGWRAKLELPARQMWELCRQHLWLPRVISFTRPLLAPNAMAYTEWTLRALDGLGLASETRVREAITLPATVTTFALVLAAEAEASQETGVTLDRWWVAWEPRAAELLDSGRFPGLANVSEDVVRDLDGLFEYGLARHLDGLAQLVDRSSY